MGRDPTPFDEDWEREEFCFVLLLLFFSQESASMLVVSLLEENGLDSLVKDHLEVFSGLCGAFDVFDRMNALGQFQSLLCWNRLLSLTPQLVKNPLIIPCVKLCSNQDLRYICRV